MSGGLYRVVGRGRASAIFSQGEAITSTHLWQGTSVKVTCATRYITGPFEIAVPGDLEVAIEAEAESAKDAIAYLNVGREVAAYLATIANAAIQSIEPELSYDITTGKTERELFQRFVPGDGIQMSSRKIPMNETLEFFGRLAESPEMDRIVRAITQYDQALQRWALGNELLVLSHLWMGVEALAPAVLRTHLVSIGVQTGPPIGAQKGPPFTMAQG